jgi:hypothetical protein
VAKSNLYLAKPEPWPRLAGWLHKGNCTPLQQQIIERAFRDVGIQEVPPGSNMGTRIEAMTRRAGLKPPVWWCAVWAGAVLADCGVPIPRGYAACDAWIPYLQDRPTHAAIVLYGLRKRNSNGKVISTDAHHIGIVARLEPIMETIEGNRGFAGTTNNGTAVDINPMNRKDVLGYIPPERLLEMDR